MKVLLRPHGVSSALEREGDKDDDKDAAAFAAISQAVPVAVMMANAGCKTARNAWEIIRCMRVEEDCVKKARVKQLKRQLDRLEMDDSETVIVFAQKLTMLVSEIHSLGEDVSDEAVIADLFSAVPNRFGDIVNTTEQWGDLSTMSVVEAVRHLAAVEEKKKKGEGSNNINKNDDEGHSGGKKKERHDKFGKSKITCFECGEKGHFVSECEAPKKEKALLADTDTDYESALLMAMVCEHGPLVEHAKVKPKEKVAEITPLGASMQELETTKAEAERLRGELAAAEAKLHTVTHLCKAEAKDAAGTSVMKSTCSSWSLCRLERRRCNRQGKKMMR
ncbi:uncharacterized protein [Aegilops tauschii subsp. strangulata]|uniref:uncharacterized protein n=1 Tax=Aegilops tauschii subsp. strangulata TaxID=200361 RepID=UPI003CC844E4